jgi:hypothetical protein
MVFFCSDRWRPIAGRYALHGSLLQARFGSAAALALPPKNKPAGQGLAGSEPNSECRALRLYFIA